MLVIPNAVRAPSSHSKLRTTEKVTLWDYL